MNFKPFYIKHEDWMTDEQVAEVFDKAVKAGATLLECVYEVHSTSTSCGYFPFNFDYFGVNVDHETIFWNEPEDFGEDAVELTLDQVDEHLGIKSVASDNCVSSLRNVKIDLRKEDGSIDGEKSAAFQKAVFETGGAWSIGSTRLQTPSGCYIFVDEQGVLTQSNNTDWFKVHTNTEINFQYETITKWTATEKVNKETIEIDGDVYFKEDVMKALSSLKKVGE